MIIKEVIQLFEESVPISYAEDFDNTGLLIGNSEDKVTGILVTLDTLESVVEEAINKSCNLIISFHPIIFSGLKKITGASYVERTILKAIKNNIAIYAMHTALDNHFRGVNEGICERLNLTDKKILIPQKNTIKKLVTYVPTEDANKVRQALFNIGAGNIGNYSHCSFNTQGTGTFLGEEGSNPVKGKKGELHLEKEVQINITFHKHLTKKVIKTLLEVHPYEEVAYEISTLENTNQHIGMGMIGNLQTPLPEKEFLVFLKDQMKTACIRHSKLTGKTIHSVAVLGGSGSFAIDAAISAKADAYITADLKYHDFFKAENSLLLADIGHYESEQFTKQIIVSILNKKISNFAPAFEQSKIVLSQVNTNPITYFQ
jgi:dinuclear metal center YbgI/SA1388 family protein